jgi:hypothetical protein
MPDATELAPETVAVASAAVATADAKRNASVVARVD